MPSRTSRGRKTVRRARRALRRVRRWLVATHVAAALVGAAAAAAFILLWWAPPRQTGGGRSLDPVKTPAPQYAWTDLPAPHFPIPPYAKHLAGVKIVLDPGHGGRSDRPNWKRGPTGLQEAEVNLKVALFLRDFLQAAGAHVRLTRDGDYYLDADEGADLAKRAALANAWPADLFLSIHHNAGNNPEANYTVLFYHGAPDRGPASQCAAEYLLHGLNDALRLEDHLPCAVLSDLVLYKNGLGVLRATQVPAVLSEASFHSNPREEQRLRDPVYNRREAYGLFLGLARWAQAGLPRVKLLSLSAGRDNGARRDGETAVVALDDGLSGRGGWGTQTGQVQPDSLVVKLNGRPVAYRADWKTLQVYVDLPPRREREGGRLWVDFRNVFGQHVLHPQLDLPR